MKKEKGKRKKTGARRRSLLPFAFDPLPFPK